MKRGQKPDLAIAKVESVPLCAANSAYLANPDIPESLFPIQILQKLLYDHSSGRDIIWATDDYAERGTGYRFADTIEVPLHYRTQRGIDKTTQRKSQIRTTSTQPTKGGSIHPLMGMQPAKQPH